MPKLVRALGEFYDRKPRVKRQEGDRWAVANDRALGLERAGKVEVLRDLEPGSFFFDMSEIGSPTWRSLQPTDSYAREG